MHLVVSRWSHLVIHVETNGGQHWPVMYLGGVHRTPHNDKSKEVAVTKGHSYCLWASILSTYRFASTAHSNSKFYADRA